MSYVVHSSGRGRRGRKNENRLTGESRKAKAKNQELEEREVSARKVVVRNLPLNFTKALFLQHVSPLADYSYFAFHGPDPTLANQGRCRAYIRFRNEEDVAVFKEKFDGYIFIDSRGHELRCVVEMAPYQRTAIQNQEKSDQKCGDIVNTEEYKQFLESLEKKKDQPVTSNSAKVQANLAALEKSNQPETTLTPLMEFIQASHLEDESAYRRSGGGRKAERARAERPSKKAAASGGGRMDYTENVSVKQQKEERVGPPGKGRGKEIAASRSGEKSRRDDYPPAPLTKTLIVSSSTQNHGGPELERGKPFRERPFSGNKTAFPDASGEQYPVDFRQPGDRGPKAPKFREETYRGSSGPPQPPPPRKPKPDRYGAKPGRSIRPEERGSKGDYPSPTLNPANPASVVKVMKPIENPITGVKEFAQVRPTEPKPMEVASTAGLAEGSTGDVTVDRSARVRNRRPDKPLYQPGAGKRRYQN